MKTKYLPAIFAACIFALNACGKTEQTPKSEAVPAPGPASAPVTVPAAASVNVTVNGIFLGNAIGADKNVTDTRFSFGKKDTIYASLDTRGKGNATLKARWTYRKNGQYTLVNEDTQTIASTGHTIVEFHMSKPDGLPTGDYAVQIFVDDRPLGSHGFSVK
jgi:hypothetical protein